MGISGAKRTPLAAAAAAETALEVNPGRASRVLVLRPGLESEVPARQERPCSGPFCQGSMPAQGSSADL